jgi:deoxyribodipyrimidine photo-lyase
VLTRPPTVLWFRRDLRIEDHPALAAAAARGPVVGLFVIDPALWGPSGPVRRAYLASSLRALDASIGGRLVVRHGDPEEVVPLVAAEAAADAVIASGDFGPHGTVRDARVGAALVGDGRSLRLIGSPYAVDPGTVRKTDGSAYRVYTPFYSAWCAQGWPLPSAVSTVEWADLPSDHVPVAVAPDGVRLPEGGEVAALATWERFRHGALQEYAAHRDRPDLHGTSSLSAALRWGEIHPRTLLAELGPDRSHEVFRKELCWREFYADVLHHVPSSARESLRADIGGMEVDSGPDADARFTAWAQGRTGYPFVDAGMRQLLSEGWMHNRVRMVVASFLVKDLHLPWQRGAAHFMQWLRDGDLASNQHGWQWTAGTGTDAAPYFRIFNPVKQGLRFDPDGDYVRRYVPELRGLDGAAIHEPWNAPLMVPDYVDRIVDHAAERVEALRRLP